MRTANVDVYVIDASTWILHEKVHSPDVFPSFWTALAVHVKAGRVVTPRQVADEIGNGKKGVSAWVRGHNPSILCKETGRVQTVAGAVLAKFPKLTHGAPKSADPWLVAYGAELNYIVVSEEKHATGGSPKLPDACDAYKVKCIHGMAMLRALGVRI